MKQRTKQIREKCGKITMKDDWIWDFLYSKKRINVFIPMERFNQKSINNEQEEGS